MDTSMGVLKMRRDTPVCLWVGVKSLSWPTMVWKRGWRSSEEAEDGVGMGFRWALKVGNCHRKRLGPLRASPLPAQPKHSTAE